MAVASRIRPGHCRNVRHGIARWQAPFAEWQIGTVEWRREP